MEAFREAVRDLPAPIAGDLFENEEAYLLVVDLPGAVPAATTVETADGQLRVRTDRSPRLSEGAVVMHDERPDELSFEVPLPADTAATGVEASLADGVLEVTIPRRTTGTSIPIEGA